jgi:methylmalonyl-CoA/ethylmalonyl-CoA epimerase
LNTILGIPGLKRIDHIGVAVFELDVAIDWYISFLGAKLINRETNKELMVEEATLELNGSSFQMISPIEELSPITKFLKTKGQGIQQIAFEVSNLDIAVSYALANNVRVIFEDSKIGTNGCRINFLHPKDCFGILIELVELNIELA